MDKYCVHCGKTYRSSTNVHNCDNQKPLIDEAAIDEVVQLLEEKQELIETLMDVLRQACYPDNDGDVDSMALTAYAEGLRLMARYGRFKVTKQYGRRVIGKWTEVYTGTE